MPYAGELRLMDSMNGTPADATADRDRLWQDGSVADVDRRNARPQVRGTYTRGNLSVSSAEARSNWHVYVLGRA